MISRYQVILKNSELDSLRVIFCVMPVRHYFVYDNNFRVDETDILEKPIFNKTYKIRFK